MGKDNSFVKNDMVLQYFFHNEEVAFNRNPFSLLFNLVIGFLRICVLLPTLSHLLSSIPFYINELVFYSEDSFFRVILVVQIIIEIPVCLLIIYDCLNCGWMLQGYGSFIDRMKINVMSEWVGLGGNIGLFTFRLMLWIIVLNSMKFTSFSVMFSFKSVMEGKAADLPIGLLEFLTSPYMFYYAILIYTVVMALVCIKDRCFLEVEFANPWTEGYKRDWFYFGRYRHNVNFCGNTVILINVLFLCSVVFTYFSYLNTTSELFWNSLMMAENLTGYLFIFIGVVFLFRTTYLNLLRLSSFKSSSSIVLNLWFVWYSYSSIVLSMKYAAPESFSFLNYPFLIYAYAMLLFITALNTLYLLLFYPFSLLNCSFWLIKEATTRNAFCVILAYTSTIFILLSGYLAAMSLGKSLFDTEIIWADIITKLVDLFEVVFEEIASVFVLIFDVLGIIANFLVGFLCWTLILGIMLSLVILIFVGWGTPIAPESAKNIYSAYDKIRKYFKQITQIKLPLKSISRFCLKGKMTFKAAMKTYQTLFVISAPWIYFVIFWQLMPLALALFVLFFTTFERRATMEKFVSLLNFLAFIGILGMGLFFLLLLDVVTDPTFNFLILKVHFEKSWGLIFSELSYVLALLGLCLFSLGILISPTDEGVSVHKKIRMHFPGLLPCICPICDIPQDYNGNANMCLIMCGRTFVCCRNYNEKDKILDHVYLYQYYAEIAFPYWKMFQNRRNYKLKDFLICPCLKMYKEKLEKVQENERLHDPSKIMEEINEQSRHVVYSEKVFNTLDIDDKQLELVVEPSYKLPSVFRHRRSLMCDCWPSYLFDPSGLRKIPSYLTPIIIALISLFLFFKSFTLPWIKYYVYFSKPLLNLVGDNGPVTAFSQISNTNSEDSATCPPLDLIVSLVSILGNSVLIFLRPIYEPIVNLITNFVALTGLANMFPDVDLFDLIMKMTFSFFGLCSIFIIISGSCLAAMTNRYILLLTCVFSCVSFGGLVTLITLPPVIENLIDFLPLLKCEMVLFEGYYMAVKAHYFCIAATAVLLVDFVAPPLAPQIPDDYQSQVSIFERKRLDLLRLDYLFSKIFRRRKMQKHRPKIDYMYDDYTVGEFE